MKSSITLDLQGNLARQSRRFASGLERMGSRGQRAMGGLRRGIGSVGRGLDSLGNRYTALLTGAGVAYAATRAVKSSAELDKQLIRNAQTAGVATNKVKGLRQELHRMAHETGQQPEILLEGFNALIQAGQGWDQALATIKAINPAMAVTGSRATTLAGALTVAAQHFDFDLSSLEMSKELLDQMTKAGRLGNVELEDLSSVFGRVAGNAKAANLSFVETLGFAEQLSLFEKQPERLATLMDSTLRLFSNNKYRKKAEKRTGIKFFDPQDGSQRQALDVLQDIALLYQSLGTAEKKANFLGAAFEGVDLDTIKGLRILLGGDALFKVREMTGQIRDASGTISRDLDDALKNAVDQSARLKATLGAAADAFARPINKAIVKATQFVLDEKGVTGKEMIVGGGLGAMALFGLVKGGGKIMRKIGGLGAGLAAGKALEQAAGVTPVYVVNMPGSAFGAGGGPAGSSTVAKASRFAGVAAVAAPLIIPAATAATAIVSEAIGKSIARSTAAALGTSELQKLQRRHEVKGGGINTYQYQLIAEEVARRNIGQMHGTLKIEIEAPGTKTRVSELYAENLRLDVDSGKMMMMRSH